ncbi:DNA cytosine methyltransferase [Achromobacter sp. Marseille-Q0513]|uniref:DNA cytosine methyltransferase n=1 Tax=Achromobacter sp. Marseille-Q0513 TaxID=2829161 RepID=UPI001B9F66DC|nr:DNA cytosine methyltransferase [Achromobacter sp. Marseille-Q0513]MBR8657655.1 DNA cytosine methyltransferase [Achromobacter sp. Marseille-Q0513]
MRFLSVCSGIEAASVAWNPLGWKAVAFSEIEPFPSAVLAHHYPDTPNWGDMTKYKEWPNVPIDLLCGGTPCQSFSVAGLRKGLDDPRGDLMLTFGAIAAKYRPKWLVWENVPGVLSSNKGRDFGTFLGMLGELGYGFAYRVLDAQFFGVPQRRRRVFVVGCLGNWRAAAAVLFERHGLSGNPAPSRKARQNTAPTLSARTESGGGLGTDFDCDGGLIAGTLQASGRAAGSATQQDAHAGMLVARCLTRGSGGGHRYDAESETLVTHSLRGEAFDASEDGTGRGTPLVALPFDTTQITSPENGSSPQAGDPCDPLAARAHPPAIAFDSRQDPVASEHLFGALGSSSPQAQAVTTLAIRGRGDSHQLETRSDGTANALLTPNGGRAGIGVGAIHYGMQVRRLTPEECEALQAYPRNYTRIAWRGKPPEDCPDGPRYKALGNSWCTTNARWIGERIDRVNSILEAA